MINRARRVTWDESRFVREADIAAPARIDRLAKVLVKSKWSRHPTRPDLIYVSSPNVGYCAFCGMLYWHLADTCPLGEAMNEKAVIQAEAT